MMKVELICFRLKYYKLAPSKMLLASNYSRGNSHNQLAWKMEAP